MPRTEFASARGGLGPYEVLAERSGKPLSHVIELARQDRLAELFDEYGFVGRPRTPHEALRRLEKRRHDPTEKPRSPAALIGEIKARKTIWDAEDADVEDERRRRDPYLRLVELRARRLLWVDD